MLIVYNDLKFTESTHTETTTMDAYEMQFFTLARIISTGNYEIITEAIKKIEQLPIKDNYIELIDKANLPFLVNFHASRNPTAITFIQEHRRLKSIAMNRERQEIADNFYEALMKQFPQGQYIPVQNRHLLKMLLHMSESVLVKLGLRLFTDMDFSIDDYDTVMDRVYAMRNQYPEAEPLIKKFETMELQFDIVDEDLEEDEENNMEEPEEEMFDDIESQDEEDDDDDVRNASFMSNESGFESDSEELFMERHQEEQEHGQKLDNAIEEVLATILAASIRTGNPQQIRYAMDVLSGIELPYRILQKHEIARLIHEYAIHSVSALELFSDIQNLSERSIRNENRNVFNQIMKDVKKCSEITLPMMDLLVGYLVLGHHTPESHQVIEVLLEKTVPLELFQRHHLKYFLEFSGKTDAVILLLSKIRDLERAAVTSN
ncbi:unnamed protein product [Caenorhabditis brenneri]